jgi:ADP-ribosylglycohydrolase
VAPVGLALQPNHAFQVGAECAALTHGHPSGYLSAGYLSELIARVIRGEEVREAAERTRDRLPVYDGHEETLERVSVALELSRTDCASADAVAELGAGWVGEEALAIALYCALRCPDDWRAASLAAVNHSGDSDSNGSICGAILGARLGVSAIPAQWIDRVENRTPLESTAQRMHTLFGNEGT